MITEPRDARKRYESWHHGLPVDGEADTPWHQLVKRHLVTSRDLLGKRVLEVGCGRGGFACWLATQPDRASAIAAADFSVTGVRKGRDFAIEHNIGGITWEMADVEALPHADASFDTVISCETIEHVSTPRKALSELARVLKPRGRLFLTTPNYLGPMGAYRLYLRLRGRKYTEEGQPINTFTLLPLTRSWVSRAGLKVITSDGAGHYLPFPGRPPIELAILDRPRTLMRWVALHSLTVAEKP